MKRLLTLTAMLLFALCLPGCGDSHESLAKEMIATTKELVATFDTVTDAASAKSAKPKLKSLMEQLNSLNERASKLPAPTEAEMKAMDSKYSSELEELQKKLTGHMLRLAFDPKIRAELDDIDLKSR